MNARSWFREPMLALVIALPAAAVVAGIATVVIAARSSGDAGDPRVTRVAQVQTTDLQADAAAARLGLRARAAFAPDGVVSLAFQAGGWQGDALRVTLRHATDAARDFDLLLYRGDGNYAGLLPAALPAGAYNVEVAPAAGGWRIVGRLEEGAAEARLHPAIEAP